MYKQTRICVRPLSQSLSYSVTESVSHTNMANAAPVIFLSLFKQTTVDETTKKQTSSLLLRTTSHTHTKLPAVLPAKTAPVILLSYLTQTLHRPSSFASSCSSSRISNLIVCFLIFTYTMCTVIEKTTLSFLPNTCTCILKNYTTGLNLLK
jgi:hypothetical protein